ncbi:MAG: acyltransferase [Planctomycetota bacterium]|jgi:surface polysaccharide O-acyltransferase-like enzyme
MVWIDNARILAAFAVVFLHCASGVVTEAERFGSTYWWIGNAYASFVRWCVPVFVMMSGALLLDPNKSESLAGFYKKRAARILIPLLFWTVFFSVWNVKGFVFRGEPIPWSHVTMGIMRGSPFYHMWFLYMIVGLYLFAPFLRRIVSQTSHNELVFLAIILFGMSMFNFAVMNTDKVHLIINRFLLYLSYFLAGYLVRITKFRPNTLLILTVFLVSVALTSVGCYLLARDGGLGEGMYFHGNLSVTVVPMSLGIMFLLKEFSSPMINVRIGKHLASLSLGIYAIHPVFIDALEYFAISPKLYNPAFSVPLIAALVFISSLLVIQGVHSVPYVRRIV